MAGTITTTNTFASQTGPIPLSQLDANFTNVNTSINNLNIYSNYYADSSLSANTITVTTTGSQTVTYAAGLTLAIKVNNTNTGATTINVNSLGAKSLVTGTSTALNAGAITSGQIVVVIYDGTNFQLQGVFSGEGNFASIDVSGAANLNGTVTLGAGTANGVLYLNGSKVATSGSALTYNGTGLGIGVSSATQLLNLSGSGTSSLQIASTDSGGKNLLLSVSSSLVNINELNGNPIAFGIGNSEQMRLTSTGLGIGTSSPSAKLEVNGNVNFYSGTQTTSLISNTTSAGNEPILRFQHSGNNTFRITGGSNLKFYSDDGSNLRMTLDNAGNLGLGVTPSAWSGVKAFEIAGLGSALVSGGNNDIELVSNAYYNGSWKYAATGAAAHYYQASGVHYWRTASSGTAGNAITFTQAMTLDASGNLLVGAATTSGYNSNSSKIFQKSTSTDQYQILSECSANDSAIAIGHTGSVGIIGATYGTTGSFCPLVFKTSDTERMRLDTSGNFLVGTTTVSDSSGVGIKLQSSATAPEIAVVVSASTGGSYGYSLYSTGAGAYRFYTDNAGTIHATSTSITAISDQTLKTNIKPLETGLTQIMALQPRRFDWINGDATNVAGFIAQEVEQVLPDLVAPFKYTDTETKLGLKMGDMIPTLVKAIQELNTLVTAQAAEIAALKSKVGV